MDNLDPHHLAVGRHYDDQAYEYELTRLELRGPVERTMTERYLARFVPPGAVVVDAGVGAGHYDEFLALRDCRLHLVDVSTRLLDAALRRLEVAGLSDQVLDARLGSATDMAHVGDGSCDAVLMLGPLYHLLTLAEREQAVREARRVLRPGGVVAAAACNRMAGLVGAYYLEGEDGADMLDVYRQFLADGLVDPELAPTIGHAHFSTAAEFRALFEDQFDELEFVGLESFTGCRQALFLDLAPDVQQAWLELVEASASRAEAVGLSEHFMYVGRRPS